MIEKLKFYCQKVLPLVYDESLSYYEVICKVAKTVNEIILFTEGLKENIDNINKNISENVESILTEWKNDGTLEQLLEKSIKLIVSVDSYGAIGDGVTDSTDAIQRCINENPNSHIMFSGGTYIVSKTIKTYGHRGGGVIDLGGSIIKFVGGILDCGIMFGSELKDNKAISTPILINGTIDCNNVVNTGIITYNYYSTINYITIRNPIKIGLQVGERNNIISSSSKIDNLRVTIDNDFEWSEKDRTGILCLTPDNYFTGVNIGRFKTGVTCCADNNHFNSSHIWFNFKESTKRNIEGTTAFEVRSDLISDVSALRTIFLENIYFDSCGVCVKNSDAEAKVWKIVCKNSNYYFSNSIKSSDETPKCLIFYSEDSPTIIQSNFTALYCAENYLYLKDVVESVKLSQGSNLIFDCESNYRNKPNVMSPFSYRNHGEPFALTNYSNGKWQIGEIGVNSENAIYKLTISYGTNVYKEIILSRKNNIISILNGNNEEKNKIILYFANTLYDTNIKSKNKKYIRFHCESVGIENSLNSLSIKLEVIRGNDDIYIRLPNGVTPIETIESNSTKIFIL